MSEQQIEQEIQEKGLNAPRLTPDHIDAQIISEQYFVFPGTTVTICLLTLRNGFTVTGESACASPENFNEEIGRKIAREQARDKIWMLEGYLLKEKLHTGEKFEASSGDNCASSQVHGVGISEPQRDRRYDDAYLLLEALSRGFTGSFKQQVEGKLEVLINQIFPDENKEGAQTEQPSTPKDRVVQEQAELSDKLEKLGDFIAKGKPEFLDSGHWHLLAHQFDVMQKYNSILIERLDLF